MATHTQNHQPMMQTSTHATVDAVVLELPFPCAADARRALRRGAYRAAARVLRDELGYSGAALALEAYAEGLRDVAEIDGDATVVDLACAEVEAW